MIETKISHSDDPIIEDAIDEIIEECNAHFGSRVPQAGILNAPTNIDHALLLRKIDEAYPNIELIGCTSYCQASSEKGFCADSILLCLFYSEDVEIKAGVGRELSKNTDLATEQAAKEALAKSSLEPKVCITTPESLTTASEYVVKGLQKALGENFPIVGGTASDPFVFEETAQFYKTEVLTDAAPILLFCGPVKFSIGIASGWEPVGSKMRVTTSDGHLVSKVGDQSAIDFYKKYLGGTQISPEYPIAILESETSDKFYLRAPLKHDDATGTIQFAGMVPQGSIIQMTRTTRDHIIDGTTASIQQAIKNFPEDGKYAGAIAFSCCGREVVLGSRTEEEIELIKKSLPEDLPIAGYYSYGEIAPLEKGHPTRFHNETVVTLLLG